MEIASAVQFLRDWVANCVPPAFKPAIETLHPVFLGFAVIAAVGIAAWGTVETVQRSLKGLRWILRIFSAPHTAMDDLMSDGSVKTAKSIDALEVKVSDVADRLGLMGDKLDSLFYSAAVEHPRRLSNEVQLKLLKMVENGTIDAQKAVYLAIAMTGLKPEEASFAVSEEHTRYLQRPKFSAKENRAIRLKQVTVELASLMTDPSFVVRNFALNVSRFPDRAETFIAEIRDEVSPEKLAALTDLARRLNMRDRASGGWLQTLAELD